MPNFYVDLNAGPESNMWSELPLTSLPLKQLWHRAAPTIAGGYKLLQPYKIEYVFHEIKIFETNMDEGHFIGANAKQQYNLTVTDC